MIETKKEKSIRISKVVSAVLKFSLLVIIIVIIPAYIYFFHNDVIMQFSSAEAVQEIFSKYTGFGFLLVTGLQVLQIIICILPGQWIQIAGAYMYGFGLGIALAIIGAAIGTVITYFLAKILGRDAVHLIFGEDRIEHFMGKLNSKKAFVLIFIIYLIPGVPKDLCNYAAGISEMKLKPFLAISLIARTPAMMISVLIGTQLGSGNYTMVIVITILMIILFALGVIYRKRILVYADRLYDKLIK